MSVNALTGETRKPQVLVRACAGVLSVGIMAILGISAVKTGDAYMLEKNTARLANEFAQTGKIGTSPTPARHFAVTGVKYIRETTESVPAKTRITEICGTISGRFLGNGNFCFKPQSKASAVQGVGGAGLSLPTPST